MNFIFRAEFLNAFNTPWFTPVTGIGNDPDDYLVDRRHLGPRRPAGLPRELVTQPASCRIGEANPSAERISGVSDSNSQPQLLRYAWCPTPDASPPPYGLRPCPPGRQATAWTGLSLWIQTLQPVRVIMAVSSVGTRVDRQCEAASRMRWKLEAGSWELNMEHVAMSDKIEARGYAHPEVLVSTDWVEEHLKDPKVRLIESNEDTLLYASGHVPGAVHVDWTTDLNDQIRRDYITREGFEALMSRIGATPRHDRRVLRRQEQLVGVLRVLGVPAVRPHEREGHGRRPPQVGEGEAAVDARRADVLRDDNTRRRTGTTQRTARFRDEVLAHLKAAASSSTCAAPRSTRGRACTCPTTRTKARCAAATFPARRASRGRARSTRRTGRSRPRTS